MSTDPIDADLSPSVPRDSGETRTSDMVATEGPTGSVSDEAGQAGGDLVGPDGRHITLRFPAPVLDPPVSGVAADPVAETLQGAVGSELGGGSLEYQSLEERVAIGGPNDRWFFEESLSDDSRPGLDSSDDALVRRQRRARWIALAVMCVALALIGGAVLRGAKQLGAHERVSLPSTPSARTVAVQSSAPSAATPAAQPQIATRPVQPEIVTRPAQPQIATRPAQPEVARQTAGEAEYAVDTASPADPAGEGVRARTPQASAKAPAAPRRSKSAHRALGRRSTGHAETPSRRRQAEPQRGIPVSEVYVNSRGELVDAQGKPLELRGADQDAASPTDPVPSAEQTGDNRAPELGQGPPD